MRKLSVLLAALLGGVALNSHAQDVFVGGEVGVAVYPDFTGDVANSTIKAGFTSADVKQDASSVSAGIFGGAWITDNFGVEADYIDLGNIKGTVTTTPPSNTFYKYSANAFSVAGLGGVKLGGRGRLYGKVGLYRASVKFESATRSVTTDSTGLAFGGGYSFRFTSHLLARAELTVYNGVKFQTFNASQGTNTSDYLTKVAVGAAYVF